jgi:hypothetical protein
MEGQSRSVTVVASYLIRFWQLDSDEALAHIADHRHHASPNREFRHQLWLYHLFEHHYEACIEQSVASFWDRKALVSRWFRNSSMPALHFIDPDRLAGRTVEYWWAYRIRDWLHHRYLVLYNLYSAA